jgi:hypothetical protein
MVDIFYGKFFLGHDVYRHIAVSSKKKHAIIP